MGESSSTWGRVSNPQRDYWRRRESGWRALGIKSLETHGAFNRFDYRRLWLAQGGTTLRAARCGLCDRDLVVRRWEAVDGLGNVGTGQGIDVDHAHSHGFARALLHGRCNQMVGLMDSKHALLVLNYLLRHEAEVADGEVSR